MAIKSELRYRIGEPMDDVKRIVDAMRPILEEQGEKIARHLENSTNDRIDKALGEKLPGAISEAFKATLDVDPNDREEVRQVRQNLQFLSKLRKQTDIVGGRMIRLMLTGLFGLAGYGAYLKWWGK